MMPREQFYALERRRDARWESGQDPDVETDKDPEDNDNEDPPDVPAVDVNAEDEVRLPPGPRSTVGDIYRM